MLEFTVNKILDMQHDQQLFIHCIKVCCIPYLVYTMYLLPEAVPVCMLQTHVVIDNRVQRSPMLQSQAHDQGEYAYGKSISYIHLHKTTGQHMT